MDLYRKARSYNTVNKAEKIDGYALWSSLFNLIDEKRLDIELVHHRRARKKELKSLWILHLYSLVSQKPTKNSLDLDRIYRYSNIVSLAYKDTCWNSNIRKFWKLW